MSKLLIVENNTDFAFVIHWHFEMLGMTVFTEQTGSEALHVYKEQRPDIILLDINLKGDIDGKEVARTIRKTDKETPIIFMSGYSKSPKDIKEVEIIGCSYFLKKPISLYEIENHIKKALNISLKEDVYQFKDTTININNRTIAFGDVKKQMSDKENSVLHLLSENLNNVVPLDVFYKKIWGNNSAEDILRNNISSLRKKLKGSDVHIKTLKNRGYQLNIIEE